MTFRVGAFTGHHLRSTYHTVCTHVVKYILCVLDVAEPVFDYTHVEGALDRQSRMSGLAVVGRVGPLLIYIYIHVYTLAV